MDMANDPLQLAGLAVFLEDEFLTCPQCAKEIKKEDLKSVL